MTLFSQALTYPAFILPVFAGAALFFALLLRHRNLEKPWRYRDLAEIVCLVLAIGCVALAVFFLPPQGRPQAAVAAPVIEVDMQVSRGNKVDLYLNDWQHPPESLPVVAGQRHIYRFTQITSDITLLRLDPSDVADARTVIYSLTLKAGNQVLRQFGPADLKRWNLVNVSPPQDENGGLSMLGSNDDPILWTQVPVIPVRPVAPILSPSPAQPYYPSAGLALAALLLLWLARRTAGRGLGMNWLNAPVPDRCRSLMLNSRGALAMAILSAGASLYLQHRASNTDIGIEVDMLVSRGAGVELFLNDWEHTPERLPVVEGQRHRYRFTNVPNRIQLIRLDPTDLPDARIVIYSVVAKDRSHVFEQLGPAELKAWALSNLTAPREEAGGLVLNSTNDDPVLVGRPSWQLPGGSLRVLHPFLDPFDGLFLLAMAFFLLLLLVRMSSSTGRRQAVLVAVAACAAFPLVTLVLKLNLLPPPKVSSAVGYASYSGYGKANEHFSASLLLLLCLGLGYAFARLAGDGEETVDATGPATAKPLVWISHVAIFLLLLLFFLTDLRLTLQSMKDAGYQVATWDDMNFLEWGYLVSQGLRPLRDFWFPYSGSYLNYLPFPAGTLSSILHGVLVLWVCYAAFFRATGRRLAEALVLFGLILTPVLLTVLPGWPRYLLAVDVALLYAAIYNTTRWQWDTHLPVAAFVSYAFFYEPTQVIYAGSGIALHTALTVVSRLRGRSWRTGASESLALLRQRAVYVGGPFLAGIVAAVLVYAANGMLPGLWSFERSLGDQGDYGSLPADISRWVLPILQPNTVFLLLFLLMSYAIYRWYRVKGSPEDTLGAALLVLCAASFMAMQKQIVRPHAMTQLRLFPYVATLIFGLIVWRERRPFTRFLIAAMLGLILSITMNRNLWFEIYRHDVREGPGKVAASLDVLLHRSREIEQVNASQYQRSRFASFKVENAVVDNLVQACGLRPQDSIYVLGDASLFYVLLHRLAPYVSNSYNDSPLAEQQRVLDWLQRQQPRFVIWDTATLGYDNVPHHVRLPLIYSYVVEHYQFVRAIGPYQILEQRTSGQPADLASWRSVLGNQVDLGHIPALARSSEYAPCERDTSRCDAVLVVKYRQGAVPHNKLAVDVAAPGGSLRIQFDPAPGQQEYVINLNRLWFWNALPKSNPPRLTAADGAAEAVMQYRRERSPVLY